MAKTLGDMRRILMRRIHVCPECGVAFSGHKRRKFCSRHCLGVSNGRRQVEAWNKTETARLLIAERNQTPEMREKVAAGLRRRKQTLGNAYHTDEAKSKIGAATRDRWHRVKDRLLSVLERNGDTLRVREGYPYAHAWKRLVAGFNGESRFCWRCGRREAIGFHHVIPVRFGGQHESCNVIPLCRVCHPVVEKLGLFVFEIVGNWMQSRSIVKQRCLDAMGMGRLT